MEIHAIITGSTGMVGKGVLFECLQNPVVKSVLVINRQSVGVTHPKLREIIHTDFHDFSAIESELRGYHACFFCLGISAAGLSEAAYRHITYDMTLQLAQTLLRTSPQLTFCYVSGAGTDHTLKSRLMWARVKGETENALLELPFRDCYLFRPAFIQPMDGIRSRTPLYNGLYAVLKPFYPLLKNFPQYVTSSQRLAKAMVKIVGQGYEQSRLESADINLLADR